MAKKRRNYCPTCGNPARRANPVPVDQTYAYDEDADVPGGIWANPRLSLKHVLILGLGAVAIWQFIKRRKATPELEAAKVASQSERSRI